MSLNERADRRFAEFQEKHAQDAKAIRIASRLQHYESLFSSETLIARNIHWQPEYKRSYEKLIQMYKNEEIDGTTVTHIRESTPKVMQLLEFLNG